MIKIPCQLSFLFKFLYPFELKRDNRERMSLHIMQDSRYLLHDKLLCKLTVTLIKLPSISGHAVVYQHNTLSLVEN